MLKINFCLILLSLLSLQKIDAQESSTGREEKKSDINFTEVANYYKEHPLPVVRREPRDEDDNEEQPRHTRQKYDPSKVHLVDRNRAGRIAAGPVSASPRPNDTILSTVSDGSAIPPDTHGSVDSQYIVTTINTVFHVQKRTGANVQDLAINAFWSSVLPSGDDGFDPRIHYDPHYKRWIYITDANNSASQQSYLLIAVSATNDPTGVWHRYAISIDATNATWLDFPCVGFNNRWVVVSGNMFTTAGHSNGAVVYVFNYDSLMTGTGAPYTKFTESSQFTMCPAQTFDTTQQNMFLVDINRASTGKLELWKISGPVASPTIASVGFPTTTTFWQNGGSADFVPQLGTTNKVQAGDDRITNVTYRNNALWCAHTVFLPATGSASRCSVMWWQIDTLANPLQNGLIDDPVTPSFFDYPSISVNANNDALLGFGYLSPYMHPSAAYALHMHTDPSDSMEKPFIFRHGQNTYYQIFSGTQNRWGDYSGTCVDPINNLDFWTIQESVPASPANYWDTWWAYVKACPAVASYTVAHDTINKSVVDTISFSGNAPSGTVFTWNFGGGTATPGTGAGPQAVTWSSYGWKTVTLTDSVAGCASASKFVDSIWVINLAGVANVSAANDEVTIQPNPSTGNFEIVFAAAPIQTVTVHLFDEAGRKVYENSFDAVAGNRVTIQASNLPGGIYIARIGMGGNTITQKIVIAK